MHTAPSSPVAHFFTVDVEEHFQVSAFDALIPRDAWDAQPSRVERNVEALLDLLDRHRALGTFFVLGWIAERRPGLVRRIAERGHEIASHGWWHRRVHGQRVAEFREDVRSSRALLEDVTGRPVLGYRAPSFSIVPGTEWAFDVLLEEGYRYDSSLFPVRRRGYGYPGTRREPHVIGRPAGELLEFPLATFQWSGTSLPAAGGGYLRHFPFALVRGAFAQHARRGVPATFYIHPWEIDAAQPRIDASLLTRVRHYRGLAGTLSRMDALLAAFPFTSIASSLAPAAAPLATGAPAVEVLA